MATVMASHPGYDYYTRSASADATAYGHTVCSQELSYNNRATCVSSARKLMVLDCPNSIRIRMVLQDHRIQYEDYSCAE
ncbi:hypothetical protein NL676_018866 [Syzygium grande]|nr:hypothetical protein NL676_018866 [Syzygium grande]